MKIRSMFMVSPLLILGALATSPTVSAAPITGVELGTPFTWNAASTNALNYARLVPGRIGQIAPFVLFDSATPTSVTLQFNNGAPGLARFEYRIDGIAAGTYAHPVVPGDTHPPCPSLPEGSNPLLRTFTATDMVEVRLALGGERDWDFNWTSFDVQAVPEPTSLGLLASASSPWRAGPGSPREHHAQLRRRIAETEQRPPITRRPLPSWPLLPARWASCRCSTRRLVHYAHGVDETPATLPAGWDDRLVPIHEGTKDMAFLRVLLRDSRYGRLYCHVVCRRSQLLRTGLKSCRDGRAA